MKCHNHVESIVHPVPNKSLFLLVCSKSLFRTLKIRDGLGKGWKCFQFWTRLKFCCLVKRQNMALEVNSQLFPLQVIITAIPHHSFGLAIYGNYLYWTDWMLRAVVRANKYDGTGIVWLRKNLERQPMGIVAVADDSNDCTLNACHADNNNCSDKCYTDETGQPFCQCTYGRLKADGKSCACKFKNCLFVSKFFVCFLFHHLPHTPVFNPFPNDKF